MTETSLDDLLRSCFDGYFLTSCEGPAFEEYAEEVYGRCMRILAARLTARSSAAAPTANGTATPFAVAPFQKPHGAAPRL